MPQKPYLDPKLWTLALLALVVKLFSLSPHLVERYYATGIYPPISFLLRSLFGPIPFSVGDVLYLTASVYLIYWVIGFLGQLRHGTKKGVLLGGLFRLLRTGLLVYILFQVLWGLNYSRQGIGGQMGLKAAAYNLDELKTVARQILVRLAATAPHVDTAAREALNRQKNLNAAAMAAYNSAQAQLPFLQYKAPSIKASLFTPVGHLVGFTGYYNPFTGEAQVKTDIPLFLKPFVTTHEMAHQLGYAKESEANFVAYLTSRASMNNEVRYAVYFELFLYTYSEMRRTDSVAARRYSNAAPKRVQADLKELQAYLERSSNPVEPYISQLYDAYLRWNNQPKGRQSYNEVTAWLVAYGKKYGIESI